MCSDRVEKEVRYRGYEILRSVWSRNTEWKEELGWNMQRQRDRQRMIEQSWGAVASVYYAQRREKGLWATRLCTSHFKKGRVNLELTSNCSVNSHTYTVIVPLQHSSIPFSSFTQLPLPDTYCRLTPLWGILFIKLFTDCNSGYVLHVTSRSVLLSGLDYAYKVTTFYYGLVNTCTWR